MNWRKSRRSYSSGQCAEVASLPGIVLVRDSKDPDGPVLPFMPNEWVRFLGSVRGKNGPSSRR